ncbi:MAG: DNA-directed RNA polymerase subunit omega [Planctomycetes bacterium]|nr:DNA-directed RNA polymerase subunit omega [Planctomycetota bacterium]
MVLDQAKLERLTKIVGGRFKLTALLQKRLVSLMKHRREGTRVPSTAELIDIAVREIDEGKIILLPPAEKEADELPVGDADENEKE